MNWYKKAQGRYDHIPDSRKGGNCFQDAFNYVYREGIIKGNKNLELIHAIICPLMGPLAGVEFGHAWVESGDKVIDTSRQNEVMDKQTYYMLGGLLETPSIEDMRNGKSEMRVKEEKIHRYSIEEAQKLCVDHEAYGPWNEELDEFVVDREDEDGSD